MWLNLCALIDLHCFRIEATSSTRNKKFIEELLVYVYGVAFTANVHWRLGWENWRKLEMDLGSSNLKGRGLNVLNLWQQHTQHLNFHKAWYVWRLELHTIDCRGMTQMKIAVLLLGYRTVNCQQNWHSVDPIPRPCVHPFCPSIFTCGWSVPAGAVKARTERPSAPSS